MLTSILWLTLNVYHEARSEPAIGRQAVAHVTMNRAKLRRLPIKEVVLQPYQFTWTTNTNPVPRNYNALVSCFIATTQAINQPDFTGGATHYHRIDVIPEWTNRLTYVGQYGVHKFYKEKN